MTFLKWIWLPLSLLPAPIGLAQEAGQPRYNLVSFQAEAQREVRNDLLNATLYVELTDSSAATLANALNKSSNEALRVAKDYKTVRVRSGNNQTFPVYSRSNQLQGWRGRAEVRIESRDFEAASALIGKLQSTLQLGNISFSVAPDTRRSAEDELTVEAIAAFKARAEIVRNALSGGSYKLSRLNVTSGSNVPQPRFALARAASASPEVTAPSLEAGVSIITVTANGSVEIVDK
jgi:predicted secreted protein